MWKNLNFAERIKTTKSVLSPILFVFGVLGTFTVSMYWVVGGIPAHIVLTASICCLLYFI